MAIERRRILDQLRESAGLLYPSLPPEMIAEFIATSYEAEREILLGAEKDRSGVIRVLRELKGYHQEQVPPSKLAAEFVGTELAENFEIMAFAEAKRGRIPLFIYFADLHIGTTLFGALMAGAATSDLTGKSAEQFGIFFREMDLDFDGEIPVSEEELAAMYTMRTLPLYRQFERLMSEDPTGFKLSDRIITTLRQDAQNPLIERQLLPSYDMHDFVIRGVEIGASMYKRIFPIAQSI